MIVNAHVERQQRETERGRRKEKESESLGEGVEMASLIEQKDLWLACTICSLNLSAMMRALELKSFLGLSVLRFLDKISYFLRGMSDFSAQAYQCAHLKRGKI